MSTAKSEAASPHLAAYDEKACHSTQEITMSSSASEATPVEDASALSPSQLSSLQQQLEELLSRDNLSRDPWFLASVSHDLSIGIDQLLLHPQVVAWKTSAAAIMEAAKNSNVLMLKEGEGSSGCVSPIISTRRTTLFFRSIPSDYDEDKIRKLVLESPSISSEEDIASIHKEMNNIWLVKLTTEEAASATAIWLRSREDIPLEVGIKADHFLPKFFGKSLGGPAIPLPTPPPAAYLGGRGMIHPLQRHELLYPTTTPHHFLHSYYWGYPAPTPMVTTMKTANGSVNAVNGFLGSPVVNAAGAANYHNLYHTHGTTGGGMRTILPQNFVPGLLMSSSGAGASSQPTLDGRFLADSAVCNSSTSSACEIDAASGSSSVTSDCSSTIGSAQLTSNGVSSDAVGNVAAHEAGVGGVVPPPIHVGFGGDVSYNRGLPPGVSCDVPASCGVWNGSENNSPSEDFFPIMNGGCGAGAISPSFYAYSCPGNQLPSAFYGNRLAFSLQMGNALNGSSGVVPGFNAYAGGGWSSAGGGGEVVIGATPTNLGRYDGYYNYDNHKFYHKGGVVTTPQRNRQNTVSSQFTAVNDVFVDVSGSSVGDALPTSKVGGNATGGSNSNTFVASNDKKVRQGGKHGVYHQHSYNQSKHQPSPCRHNGGNSSNLHDSIHQQLQQHGNKFSTHDQKSYSASYHSQRHHQRDMKNAVGSSSGTTGGDLGGVNGSLSSGGGASSPPAASKENQHNGGHSQKSQRRRFRGSQPHTNAAGGLTSGKSSSGHYYFGEGGTSSILPHNFNRYRGGVAADSACFSFSGGAGSHGKNGGVGVSLKEEGMIHNFSQNSLTSHGSKGKLAASINGGGNKPCASSEVIGTSNESGEYGLGNGSACANSQEVEHFPSASSTAASEELSIGDFPSLEVAAMSMKTQKGRGNRRSSCVYKRISESVA